MIYSQDLGTVIHVLSSLHFVCTECLFLTAEEEKVRSSVRVSVIWDSNIAFWFHIWIFKLLTVKSRLAHGTGQSVGSAARWRPRRSNGTVPNAVLCHQPLHGRNQCHHLSTGWWTDGAFGKREEEVLNSFLPHKLANFTHSYRIGKQVSPIFSPVISF